MTVAYDDRISRLFFYWKASVWQLVWADLFFFSVFFAVLSCTYRFVMSEPQRETFEDLVLSISPVCDSLVGTVSFLLGFFVNANVTRWWTQFELLPWPEELMNSINFCMFETDEEMHLVRRAAARYFCLTTALAGRLLSSAMMKRFPTEQEIVKIGLMTDTELAMYHKTPKEVKFFIPMIWAQRILAKQAKQRQVAAPHSNYIEKELSEVITRFRKLFCYDWVCIPLVYTQCVALAVYTYFAACVIGRQFLNPTRDLAPRVVIYDYYVPVFTLLQLVFYMGWFRVGFKLMKPFGDDAEDFEVSEMLDRHIEVAYELADAPMKALPKLHAIYPKIARYQPSVVDGFLSSRAQTQTDLRRELDTVSSKSLFNVDMGHVGMLFTKRKEPRKDTPTQTAVTDKF